MRALRLCVSAGLGTALAAVALAGCGGDDEPESAPTVGAEPQTRIACEAATSDLMTPLGNKMTEEGARLRNGQILESPTTPGLYFVSAEIYGDGIVSRVGTWATENRFGGDAIYAVDDVARETTRWGDGAAEGITLDDAAEASRVCVQDS